MRDDLRHAFSALAKAPAFTLLVLLTLALGIGANTAIFSVVDQVLLSPLPLPSPEELVRVQEQHGRLLNVTGATFHDIRERTRTLGHLMSYRTFFRNVAAANQSGFPEQITAAFVSEEFFSVVATRPGAGREFASEDFSANAPKKVILGDALWRRMFGGDPNLVGRTILLHGEPAVVTGIMPAGFDFPEGVEAWAPLAETQMFRENRRSHLYRVVGRMKPGVTVEQANAELRTIGAAADSDSHFSDKGIALHATDLRESMIGDARRPLLVLLGAVALVLLIGCANVVNLQLTRAFAKHKEIATKIALGATRSRILRYAAGESLWLALGGGVLGSVLGIWAVRGIAVAYPNAIPRLDKVMLDWRILLFAALVAALSAGLAGILPALHAARIDPAGSLGGAGRSTESASRSRLRFSLLVCEMSLAVVLLAGAGLLIRSFLRLQSVDPGYDAHNVAVVPLTLPDARYATFAQRVQFADTALANLSSVTGVRSVAAAGVLPLSGAPETGFDFADRPQDAANQAAAQVFTATPGYFQTLSVPLLAGRMFTRQDSASAPMVVLINDSMAKKFFAAESPLGKIITMKDWGDPLPAQIVGVVGDIRQDSMETAPKPAVYFSFAQFSRGTLVTYFLARTDRDPQSLAGALRERIWAVDRQVPVRVSSMEQIISASLMRRRFLMTLLLAFAGLALLLASVGIYGVISYSVSQRTREFGIRFAVGAQRNQVLGLVLRQCLLAVGIGIAEGLAASAGLTRTMTNMLYGVSANDPLTFLCITGLLVVVAIGASLAPAVRAMKVDPMVALRSE